MNITRTILFCGSAMYMAVPAIAQDRNPVVAQSSQTESNLEEIVVTARRREERLQNVPVSVSAFSAEALERSTVQELRGINVLTPGLTFSNEGGAGNATLSLRGIGQIPLGEGTPGVVIYVNNMALPPDGSNVPTYDIASIQALKGPQGTLFGKNTLGGAVLVSSRAPDYRFGGYVEGTFGRFDYRDLQGAINIPIVEDRVSLRVAGQIRRQDPRTRSFDGGPGFDNIDQEGARISLLLEPIDNLKSTTIAEYYKQDQLFGGVNLLRQNFPFTAFPFPPGWGASLDAQVAPYLAIQRANERGSFDGGVNGGLSYVKSKSIINDTSYDFGDTITLRNIFGYRQVEVFEGANTGATGPLTVPGPGGPIPFVLFTGFIGADREYLTNETQILGEFDRFNFIAGFYYNNDKPRGPSGSAFTAFSVGGLPSPPITSQVENDNEAIYGQIGFKITEPLTLNIGGRYSWDDATSCGGNVPGTAGIFATDEECRAVAALNDPNDGIGSVDNSSEEPSYTIGLDYKVTPDWMVYGQHRRGFRSANVNTPLFETWYTTCAGTPVPGGVCFDLRPFQKTDVEELLDFEVGSKLTFDLGGAQGRWNVAAYRDSYKGSLQFLNTQTLLAAPPGSSVPDSPNRGAVGVNVADQTIWGIETEFSIAPTDNFYISFNGAYTHVSVDSITLPPGFPPGIFSKEAVNKFAPTFSGTLAASWTLPFRPLDGEVVLNADVFTTDDFGGQGGEKLPGYQLANARLDWKGLGGTGIELGVFVRNLTDEFYVAGAAVLVRVFPTSSVYLGAPRTWGVTGRYRF